MTKHYLTRESYNALVVELKERQVKARKEIAERIREAKVDGDLSENAAYELARQEESRNEGRIEQLEALLREAEIVEEAHLKNVVEIGDEVELSGGLKFTLVDSQQVAPPKKISFESPLGSAILGKKIGEKVSIKTPEGETKEYTILRVD